MRAVRDAAATSLQDTDLTSGLTGNAAIQVDTTSAFDHADTFITITTVILIVVLLGLIFRSPVISIIPVIVIGIVLKLVTGITAALADGFGFQVSISLQSILVVVLFGPARVRLRDGPAAGARPLRAAAPRVLVADDGLAAHPG